MCSLLLSVTPRQRQGIGFYEVLSVSQGPRRLPPWHPRFLVRVSKKHNLIPLFFLRTAQAC